MATMAGIPTILSNIRTMILWPLLVGISVIMFLYAGILYLTSVGNPDKIAKANKAVIFGIIGIFVGLAAYVAVGLIRTVLGIPTG